MEEGDQLARIKLEIFNVSQTLDQRKKLLEEEKLGNKRKEEENKVTERAIIDQRTQNKGIKETMEDLNAEVQILKNQLSAFASDLSQKQ